MKELKWLLFVIFTAGLGFLIYKIYKKDSNQNAYFDSFAEGYMSGFGATKSPTNHKEYGEIAREIQHKQAKTYSKINAEYKKNLTQ